MPMNNPWQRVHRHHPCPICDKPDWCRVSADGQWAICRRLNTGDGRRKVDKAGMEYWVYALHQDTTRASYPPLPPTVVPPVRASVAVLHQVYSALLGALTLAPAHHDQLTRRGLPDAAIRQRRYRTLPPHGRAALAKRLVEAFGDQTCAQVPGLYLRRHDGRHWWSLAGAAGLLIPVRNAAGQVIALTVRSDAPDAPAKYSAVSSVHYRGPGPGAQTHVPLAVSPAAGLVRLTE